MIEALGNQSPAANERISQNQCGIVPDEPVARSSRVADEYGQDDNQDSDDFFHDERRRINRVRV